MKRLSLVLITTLLIAIPALAGTCPSNVPSGVTNCFFIDYISGSDAATGGTKVLAWQHAPSFANVTGGSVAALHTPAAGEGWIFKGGVTVDWHAWPASVPWNGTAPNPTYIGVDPTWYTGGSWTRPIFSGGGSTGFDATTAGFLSDASHQTSYFILDSIEFTGLYWSGDCGNTATTTCNFLAQYSFNGTDVGWEVKNIYAHGWSHNSAPFNDPANNGSLFWLAQEKGSGTSIHDSVISGADTTRDCCFAGIAWAFYNNYVEYVANGVFGEEGLVHDNTFLNFVPSGGNNGVHANCIHLFGNAVTTELYYNNYVSCYTGSTAVEFFLVEENQDTLYAFNNVLVNDGHLTGFELSSFSGGTTNTYRIFNNTVECGIDPTPSGTCVYSKSGVGTEVSDNFFVDSHAYYVHTGGTVAFPSPTFSITCSGGAQTNFGAYAVCAPIGSGNGTGNLNITETYPFAPLDATAAATVGTGQNNSSYCTTISGINAAAGTACLSDTTLGVAYNSSSHTVTFPKRTALVRPTGGGNWRNGAYEFGGTAIPTFSPVAGAYASTQNVTISTTTGGATLCYTTDGSTPTADGAGTCTHGTTYSTPVAVASSLTLKAIGSLSGNTDSVVGAAAYNITFPTPTAAVPSIFTKLLLPIVQGAR
jgi:Chitobiase/beta-hexosaminidase C-terminal domain